jgi:hypothetical protein
MAKYKKMDVTMFFSSVVNDINTGEFIADSFKENYGNISQISNGCFRLSLVGNETNQLLDFDDYQKSTENIQTRIKSRLKELPNEKLNVDFEVIDSLAFSDQFCKFAISNPFQYRGRALIFVFIFNIFHTAVLMASLQLLRFKNKDN